MRDVWSELRYFIANAGGPIAFSIVSDDGEFSVALEFGHEAPDSPMAAGAAYGIDADLDAALAQALNDLSPTSRGLDA